MTKFLLLMIFSSLAFANNLSLSCSGISQFELVGATGVKEEKQEREYIFNDLILKDLNDIQCISDNEIIECDSNFLNVRSLKFDLKSMKLTDFISGNKGFGQYIESFKGQCQKK